MNGPLSWSTPECDPVGYVSYSEWSSLRTCSLKAAFARAPKTKHWDRGSIWSGVGNARHGLVEEIETSIRGGLEKPSSTWVRRRFDVLLEWERDRLVAQWRPAQVPPVKRWPDVVYIRSRLATNLGGGDGIGWPDASAPIKDQPATAATSAHQEVAPRPTAGGSLIEAWVQDDRRRFRGRVDRIDDREGRLVVVDLKSGVGSTSEELLTRHREQMLFYAGLVQASYTEWPELELHPAAAAPVAVPYRIFEVENQRATVEGDRASFNSALAAGTLRVAARPGAGTCAWCPFQVVCPALIEAWNEVSAQFGNTPSRSVSLAAGTVRSVRRSPSATDVVVDQNIQLSVPPGEVSVTRLPSTLHIEVGDNLVVAGAEVAGGTQVLRARWDSRVRVEQTV